MLVWIELLGLLGALMASLLVLRAVRSRPTLSFASSKDSFSGALLRITNPSHAPIVIRRRRRGGRPRFRLPLDLKGGSASTAEQHSGEHWIVTASNGNSASFQELNSQAGVLPLCKSHKDAMSCERE
jgi:hypothetical protein